MPTATKKLKTRSKLSAPFYTQEGVKKGTVALPVSIFGQRPNLKLVAQAVRVFLSNQRKAHAKARTRAEVKRTTKKLYRQKGTGGARHGSRRAPIFVGGGVAHGPTGISRKLTITKKAKRKALIYVLSQKAKDQKIIVADIEETEPKTKKAAILIKKITTEKPTIVFKGGESLYRAARNLANVSLVRGDNVSVYDIAKSQILLFTKEGKEELEKRFVRKEKQ